MSDVITMKVERKCSECGETFYETLVGRDDEVINNMPDDGRATCPTCIKSFWYREHNCLID